MNKLRTALICIGLGLGSSLTVAADFPFPPIDDECTRLADAAYTSCMQRYNSYEYCWRVRQDAFRRCV